MAAVIRFLLQNSILFCSTCWIKQLWIIVTIGIRLFKLVFWFTSLNLIAVRGNIAFLQLLQHDRLVENNKSAAHQLCVSLLPCIWLCVPDCCSAPCRVLGLMVQHWHLIHPSFPQEHNDLSREHIFPKSNKSISYTTWHFPTIATAQIECYC